MLEINFNEPASLGEEIGKYRPAGDRQSLDLLGNRKHYPQTSSQGNIALVASKLAWGKYLLRKRPHRCQPEKQLNKMPPGDTWTRYAQVSSTFKMIFKCFIILQAIVLAFMFFICNAYQKFGHFCKQNSKNKNRKAIYLNNVFY